MLDPIGVVFQLKDQASGPLGKLRSEFEQLHGTSGKAAAAFAKHAKQLGQGLAMLGGGALGAATLKGLADEAMGFEAALTKMASVARASTQDVQQLSRKALQLGVAFEFSPDQAVLGMKALASAGLNVNQILGSITPALRMAGAAAGEISIPQAAETLTASMKGYGFAVTDSAKIVDTLAKSTQISNLRFGELQQALGNAAGEASVANQSFDTTVATLGALRNVGLTAMSASEKLRQSLRALIQPKALQQAAKLGVALRTPTGQLRQLDSIVTDLHPKLAKLTQQQQETALANLFSPTALVVYQAIAKADYTNATGQLFQGAAALTAMRQELQQSAGTAKTFQDAFLGSTAGVQQLLQGTLQTFRIVLGKPLLDPLKRLTKALLGSLNVALDLFVQAPKLRQLATGILALGSGFALVVGGLIAAKSGLALLALVIGPVGAALGGMVLLLAKGALLAGALGVAFAGVKKAVDANLGGIGDAVSGLAQRIDLLGRTAWGFFTQGGISDTVKKELDGAGMTQGLESLMRTFRRAKAAWQGLKQGFIEGFAVLKPALHTLLVPLAGALNVIQQALGRLGLTLDHASGGATRYTSSLQRMAHVGRRVGHFLGGFAAGLATVGAGVASTVGSVLAVLTEAATQFIRILVHPVQVVREAWQGLLHLLQRIGQALAKPLQLFRNFFGNGLAGLGGMDEAIGARGPLFAKTFGGTEAFPEAANGALRAFAAKASGGIEAPRVAAGVESKGPLAPLQGPQEVTPVPPKLPLVSLAGVSAGAALGDFGAATDRRTAHIVRQTLREEWARQGPWGDQQTPAGEQGGAAPPTHITTALTVDGHKMAQVVHTHTRRAAAHQGDQL